MATSAVEFLVPERMLEMEEKGFSAALLYHL